MKITKGIVTTGAAASLMHLVLVHIMAMKNISGYWRVEYMI